MGEVSQFKEERKVALPSYDEEVYKHAEVTEGEEVSTLRAEEQGTQTLFVNTSKIPREKGDRSCWRRTG